MFWRSDVNLNLYNNPQSLTATTSSIGERTGLKSSTTYNTPLQLTVGGPSSQTGRSALLNVEEGPRLGPDPVLTLLLTTVELIARGKRRRLRTAILIPVQVTIKRRIMVPINESFYDSCFRTL